MASPAPGWRWKKSLMYAAVAWEYLISWIWRLTKWNSQISPVLNHIFALSLKPHKWMHGLLLHSIPFPSLLHFFVVTPSARSNQMALENTVYFCEFLSDAIWRPEISRPLALRSPPTVSDANRRQPMHPIWRYLTAWDLQTPSFEVPTNRIWRQPTPTDGIHLTLKLTFFDPHFIVWLVHSYVPRDL